jgi:hypothetical protein
MPVPSGEHVAAVELLWHDLGQSGREEEAGIARTRYARINGLTDGRST